MSSIKEAIEKVRERAMEVKKTAVDLLGSLPKPVRDRPTLFLNETIMKRLINRRIEKINRRIKNVGS
ncbi:MAG: hypothetical protein QXN21_04095 [Candidatus Bathyarchaeia archaeon]